MNKLTKRIVIGVTAAAVVVGGVAGALAIAKGSGDPVGVYDVNQFSIDSSELMYYNTNSSSGTVTSDRMQNVFVSTTQIVEEVYVHQGDTVKTGDPLMRYDSTLSELNLQKKDIEIQDLENKINIAKKQLEKINALRPGVPVNDTSFLSDPFGGISSSGKLLTAAVPAYFPLLLAPDEPEGSSDDETTTEDESTSSEDESTSSEDESTSSEDEPSSSETEPSSSETEPSSSETEPSSSETEPSSSETEPSSSETEPSSSETEPSSSETEPSSTEESSTEPQIVYPILVGGKGTEKLPLVYVWKSADPIGQEKLSEILGKKKSVYAVLMVREGDLEDGAPVFSVLYKLERNTEPGRKDEVLMTPVRIFTAEEDPVLIYHLKEVQPDPTETDPDNPDWPDFPDWPDDPGISYTSAEIARMKAEKETSIRELEIQLKVAQVEYKKLETEYNNTQVFAELDGTVTEVGDVEEAASSGSALIRISGGGSGYYIKSSMTEFDLDKHQPGDTASVMSYMSGINCEGKIVEISQFPSTSNDYYYGSSNSNTSYYPVTIFVDAEEGDFNDGDYVEVTFPDNGASAGDFFYLFKAFVREEDDGTYVLVKGQDDRLEKRYLMTGKCEFDASYVKIYTGLTQDDRIAFPYGDAKEGAPTREGNVEELYGGMYY